MEKTKTHTSTSYFTKLIAVSIGHFFNDFYMNLIPPILFLFVYSLDLTLSQQAFISFVITSSGSFAQPVIGYFVDKKGKPYLLIFSLIWISLWMSVSGIVTNYYLLVVVAGLGALASALFHPLGSAVAVKLANKSRGASLSVFMTVGGFAASVSPIVSIPAVKAYGLDVLLFFMIPGILAALYMYFAQIHTVEINSNIHSVNEEEHGKFNIVTAKWMGVLVFISSSKVLIRSFLITFGVQIMLLKQVDVKIAGVVLSVYLLANSFGTILGGFLNDRIGSKKVLLLFNLGALLCMAAILFTGPICMVMGFLLMGFALSGSSTSNIVMAYELLPKNLNVATGLIMGLSGGLGGLVMLLFGKIADIKGLMAGASYLMIPLLMTVIITAFLPGENKTKKPLA